MKLCAAIALLFLTLPAFAQSPNGDGDPNAITCRPPQTLPGQRLKGPEVCKTNAVWAQYRRDGMEPAADGIHDVRAEKWRSINPPVCHPATMGGGSTTAMGYAIFTPVCD